MVSVTCTVTNVTYNEGKKNAIIIPYCIPLQRSYKIAFIKNELFCCHCHGKGISLKVGYLLVKPQTGLISISSYCKSLMLEYELY